MEMEMLIENLTLGDILKKRRLSLNLTLSKVQQLTGISASYIYRLEIGQRKSPSVKIIKLLADCYNIQWATIERVLESSKDFKLDDINKFNYSNKEVKINNILVKDTDVIEIIDLILKLDSDLKSISIFLKKIEEFQFKYKKN